MARYKDIDAIIEQMNGSTAETWGKGLGRSWWSHSVMLKDNIVQLMKDAPEADVVEVVRCKDCVHGHWNQDTLYGSCVDFCDFNDLRIDKDHFCSYGERRKEIE